MRDMLSSKEEIRLCNDYITERATRGLRSIGVARKWDDGASWELVGLISLLDPPREDSAETIKFAQSMGVEVKMVTGVPHKTASMQAYAPYRGGLELEAASAACWMPG